MKTNCSSSHPGSNNELQSIMKITVLGIGNILMQDEGIGVVLMEALQGLRDWGSDVEFIDGGAGGLSLITIIEQAQRLLVLDAADMRLHPGDWRLILPVQIVQEDSLSQLTLHHVPFGETLALCEQFFKRPPTKIFAIQPAVVDFGRQLSPLLQEALPQLVSAAAEVMEQELKEAASLVE